MVLQKLIQFTDEKIQKDGFFETEGKMYFGTFTAELVACVGYGLDGNSFNQSGSTSFLSTALTVFGSSWSTWIKSIILNRYSKYSIWFKLNFFNSQFERTYLDIVEKFIEKREPSRGQFIIHMVIDLERKRSSDLKELCHTVTAHMLSLFVDVYDTTAITMNFLFYHIASNKDIQDKIREEVRLLLKLNNGHIDLELINQMAYTEQVIYEGLRLEPTVGSAVKVCTEKIELVGEDGLSCWVEPGTRVFIPTEGIHKDPQYYSEPDKFDPSKFDKDLVNSRPVGTFLGFGYGPRMCPGKKLAFFLIKMTLLVMLQKYSFEVAPKTNRPLKIDNVLFLRTPVNGIWFRIKPLQSK